MTQGLKNTLIDLLTSPIVTSVTHSVRRNKIPIFMLHRLANEEAGIRGHSLTQIERALDYCHNNGYSIISLDQAIALSLAQHKSQTRYVCFTIDDGFYDQGEYIAKLFQSKNAPLTFFLATDMVDKGHWSWDYQLEYVINCTKVEKLDLSLHNDCFTWPLKSKEDKLRCKRALQARLKQTPIEETEAIVEKIASSLQVEIPQQAPDAYRTLTWSLVKALESDLIQFGPHTQSHTVLSQLDDTHALNEIRKSKQRLQQELKNPVNIFCYPTGRESKDFGTREKKMVQELGFDAAVSADPGYLNLSAPNDPFAINRFNFPNDFSTFKKYVSWLELLRS